MKKQLFSLLTLIVLGLLIAACQSTRQTDVSVNSSNAETQNAKKETTQPEAGEASLNKSTKNENTEKSDLTDVQKNMRTDTDGKFENRCGWYSNPTPGNHWIEDKDGEWIIGVQGSDQAEGDYPPEFSDDQWIKTNGYYGYGCACLQVKVDRKDMRILEIATATAKPLSACRNDKALREPSE
ncbi:MAG: DUF4087 domain-containing protein [Pyrinomonadaceae bacterium]